MTHEERSSDSKKRLFNWSRRLGDVGLGVAVIAIVIMMVVPLTPTVIDLLIGFNIGFSALLLCLSLFMRRPLAFTSFPTLLLVATLYRLALNISSTRLILIQADAGQIIRAFGGYVVGGDILVGAVIFGILSMVLFLVITKGAERVAEVSARFSLDALPGMQLAIDSDLRAGAVSPTEASRRRGSLDEASRYFGALDGAMKFVRGDAIASLIIVLVNIIGGIAVGMLRRGMDVGTALNTYGRLTVGDGLVSMIPALLVSTAAGLLVTRVSRSDKDIDLGQEINRQLRGEPRALAAAAVLMFLLGWMPGLPLWPFLLLTILFGAVAAHRFSRERSRNLSPKDENGDREPPSQDTAAVILEIQRELYRNTGGSAGKNRFWTQLTGDLESMISRDIGLIGTRVLTVSVDEGTTSQIILRLKKAVRLRIPVPSNGRTEEHIFDIISSAICKNADCLVGMDETQQLLDTVSRTYPATVRETVPKVISLPTLAALLGMLAKDGVPLHVLPEILEIIARVGTHVPLYDLRERVREGLAPLFTDRAHMGHNAIHAYVLSPDIESVLEAALTATGDEPRLALSQTDWALIVNAVRKTLVKTPAILLAQPHLRAPLAQVLNAEIDDIVVLKSTELSPQAEVHISGMVSV